ncbi:MAG: hypothetical protein ACI9XK_005057 [Granulosicoccus sp.]|jgi:hypothetical protein
MMPPKCKTQITMARLFILETTTYGGSTAALETTTYATSTVVFIWRGIRGEALHY